MRSILQLLPLPTNPTGNPNVGTVATQLTSPSSSDQFIARGDHRFADWHTITLRYYQNVGTALNRLAGGTLPGFDATFDPVGRNAMFADTLILGSRTTNELRASYGRSSALFSPEVVPATPRFNVAGLANFGTVNNWPQGRIFNVYQVNDSLTHNRGKHILKTGFDLRHIQDNSVNDTNRRGVYTFTSLDTLLTGIPSNYTQVFGNTYRGFRTNFHAGFVQDDWRVLPSLTLNLGLRYEFQGGLREVNRLQSVLDPIAESIGLRVRERWRVSKPEPGGGRGLARWPTAGVCLDPGIEACAEGRLWNLFRFADLQWAASRAHDAADELYGEFGGFATYGGQRLLRIAARHGTSAARTRRAGW
ncbi:MAG: hypothetical protein WKF37_01095 [Bryobacteraceae bacterium]